jgi:hypothetical protein
MEHKKIISICIIALFLITMFASTINAENVEMTTELEEDPSMCSTNVVFAEIIPGNTYGVTVKVTVDQVNYLANKFSIIVTEESGLILFIFGTPKDTYKEGNNYVIEQTFIPIGFGKINVYIGAKGSVGNIWTVLDRTCTVWGLQVLA